MLNKYFGENNWINLQAPEWLIQIKQIKNP